MIYPATLEDNMLIEKVLAGERTCFDVLISRHEAAVRRRLKMIVRNAADQDDLVQETFVKAWIHLSSFHAKSTFRTWLTHIATNEALQQLRRRSRIAEPSIRLDQFACQQASPLDLVLVAENCRKVRTAVDRLPEKYRQALLARDLDDSSTEEAAARLRMGPALVKTRVFRARRMLSAAFRQELAA
jgi:RNA polymerase sigma-70 factor (ECF subfamily)